MQYLRRTRPRAWHQNKLHGMHGMCAAANCRDCAQQPDPIADLLDFGQVLGNPQPTQTRSMLLGVISALADFPESTNCYLTPCDETCYNLTRLNCLQNSSMYKPELHRRSTK